MILADSSIWIDHFKVTNLALVRAIREQQLRLHPYVIGELALGSLHQRDLAIGRLNLFRQLPVAQHQDVMILIEERRLFSRGIGYVDTHLLASCLIAGNCKLLTRDRRLRETAEQLGIAA